MKRAQLIEAVTEGLGAMKRLGTLSQAGKDCPKDMPTPAQIGLLVALAHEPLGLKDLAKRLCMSPSAATQLVDDLVRQGTVERQEDQQDRRKITLRVTPKGKQKLVGIRKFYLASFTKLLEPLSDTELVQWNKLQRKIIEHPRS